MTTLVLRRLHQVPLWVLWSYLVLITLAELITSVVSPQLGLLLHVAILLALTVHGAIDPTKDASKLALALTLAPLIRLLSLSMPLLSFPQMAWYPIVSVPLLIAMWIIVRQLGMPRQALALQRGNLILQLMLISGGLGLGAIEYAILQPNVLLPDLSWQALVLPALSLIIFTGFTEEVIFRGLLQSLALPVLGRGAIAYVALLFAVLHIGYLSFTDVAFVFAVGVGFAYIVHWGGSIFGVTLAHGLTNIMLFLVMPYLEQQPNHPLTGLMPWIVAGGSAVALLAIGILAFRAVSRSPTSSTGLSASDTSTACDV